MCARVRLTESPYHVHQNIADHSHVHFVVRPSRAEFGEKLILRRGQHVRAQRLQMAQEGLREPVIESVTVLV